MTSDRIPIAVRLNQLGYAIEMAIHHDQPPEEDVVVFADPARLKPYMDKINAVESPGSLRGRSISAQKGFLAAKISAPGEPNEFLSAVPMGKVYCRNSQEDGVNITFMDGITRTTELITQGAEFVPLQVEKQQAALLQEHVGGTRAPMPASDFVIGPKSRERERERGQGQGGRMPRPRPS